METPPANPPANDDIKPAAGPVIESETSSIETPEADLEVGEEHTEKTQSGFTMPIFTLPDIDLTRFGDLGPRIISGLVLAVGFLVFEILGGLLFTALIIAAALIMMREWDQLTQNFDARWQWAGIPYIAIPCAALIWLRDLSFVDAPEAGMGIVLYLILCVATTDIGAYFVGRKWGKTKLAPTISPGKTWEGLAGGVLAAGLVGGAYASVFGAFPATTFWGFAVAVLLGITAQAGDLFESHVKRKAGVKDSGDLIPGHGGLLDRVDGLLTASVALAIFVGCRVVFG